MRRVLVVLPELETGGGQRMAISIVHHIKNKNLKIRVLVLYPRRGNILEGLADEYGLDIQYLNKKPGIDIALMKEIYRAINEFAPDVIHAHLRVMPYLLLPMCVAGNQKRYYTVHNLADKDASGLRRRLLRFAFRYCHVQPVAISELCRKSISSVYGIPEHKIPCIYVGIDIQRFAPPHNQIHGSSFRFVAVGRLAKQKNYPLLLTAFSALHSRHPNSKLIIVGDGELKADLENMTIELGLSDSVEFTGNIPDVETRLWEAEAYVMSSDYEGLPQTVLEAMAAGLPIIATKVGGVVDVVKDGENGILVECGGEAELIAAMEKVIQSPQLCKIFSEKNIELSKQFSISQCASSYESLYLS